MITNELTESRFDVSLKFLAASQPKSERLLGPGAAMRHNSTAWNIFGTSVRNILTEASKIWIAALAETPLSCQRLTEAHHECKHIWNMRACVCVCDYSGKNNNIFNIFSCTAKKNKSQLERMLNFVDKKINKSWVPTVQTRKVTAKRCRGWGRDETARYFLFLNVTQATGNSCNINHAWLWQEVIFNWSMKP